MDNPRVAHTRLVDTVNIQFIKTFNQILKYKFFLLQFLCSYV